MPEEQGYGEGRWGDDAWGGGTDVWVKIVRVSDTAQGSGYGQDPWGTGGFGSESVWTKQPK